MSKPIHVTTDSIENDVMNSPVPVLIDFWAPWCNPCKALNPIIESLAEEFGERLKVVKINTDEEPELMQRFSVRGIPSVILITDRKETMRVVGVRSKKIFSEMLTDQLAGNENIDDTLVKNLQDDESRQMFLFTADIERVQETLLASPELGTLPFDGSKLNLPGITASVSPISLAIATGLPAERLEVILSCGPSLSASNLAALGRADELRALIANDASALEESDELNGWPIVHAIKRGHEECANILLESGADLPVGPDLVMLAMSRGSVPLVKLLRDAGLEVEQRDDPLHIAAHFAHLELLNYLLDLGMDPSVTTQDGSTALDIATTRLKRFPDQEKLPLIIELLEARLAE